MTTKQAIQHPNTDKLIHAAAFITIGHLLAQHQLPDAAQVQSYVNSPQFHAIVVAALFVFNALRNGMAKEPISMYTQTASLGPAAEPIRTAAPVVNTEELVVKLAPMLEGIVADAIAATKPPTNLPAPLQPAAPAAVSASGAGAQ